MKAEFKWIISVEIEGATFEDIEEAYSYAKYSFFDALQNDERVQDFETLQEEDK